MSKQSNSQRQTVKVVVNNNMAVVNKPKKKRKAKPRQQEEPIIDNQLFPVLNTPMPSRPSYAPMPVRNTVYMPSTVQISPDGMMPPVPDYFSRPYTNLVRTMEDFQQNVMTELDDVRRAMKAPSGLDAATSMAGEPPSAAETQTDSVQPRQRPVLTMQEPDTMFEMRPEPQSPPARVPTDQDEISLSPVQQLAQSFEQMELQEKARNRRMELENKPVEELEALYNSIKPAGKVGRPPKKKPVLLNRIIGIEVYGNVYQD